LPGPRVLGWDIFFFGRCHRSGRSRPIVRRPAGKNFTTRKSSRRADGGYSGAIRRGRDGEGRRDASAGRLYLASFSVGQPSRPRQSETSPGPGDKHASVIVRSAITARFQVFNGASGCGQSHCRPVQRVLPAGKGRTWQLPACPADQADSTTRNDAVAPPNRLRHRALA